MQENEISNNNPIEVEVSIMDCKECKHLIGLGVAQMNTVSILSSKRQGKLITIPCIFILMIMKTELYNYYTLIIISQLQLSFVFIKLMSLIEFFYKP